MISNDVCVFWLFEIEIFQPQVQNSTINNDQETKENLPLLSLFFLFYFFLLFACDHTEAPSRNISVEKNPNVYVFGFQYSTYFHDEVYSIAILGVYKKTDYVSLFVGVLNRGINERSCTYIHMHRLNVLSTTFHHRNSLNGYIAGETS